MDSSTYTALLSSMKQSNAHWLLVSDSAADKIWRFFLLSQNLLPLLLVERKSLTVNKYHHGRYTAFLRTTSSIGSAFTDSKTSQVFSIPSFSACHSILYWCTSKTDFRLHASLSHPIFPRGTRWKCFYSQHAKFLLKTDLKIGRTISGPFS